MSSDLIGRLENAAEVLFCDQGDEEFSKLCEEAADRIEALEAALAEATRLMTEASREAGKWKGKYEAAGHPGTLDGWIEKARDLEEENARLRRELRRIELINHGPDRASGEYRCIEAAAIASAALRVAV